MADGKGFPCRGGGKEEVFLALGVRVLGSFGKIVLGTIWPGCLVLVSFTHSTHLLPSYLHHSFDQQTLSPSRVA